MAKSVSTKVTEIGANTSGTSGVYHAGLNENNIDQIKENAGLNFQASDLTENYADLSIYVPDFNFYYADLIRHRILQGAGLNRTII